MAVSPSHIAMNMHGWSWIFCMAWVSCVFSVVYRAACFWCMHSRKCHLSFDLHWHDGQRGYPSCRCIFEAWSGSLSLINSTKRCWSFKGKEESKFCRRHQCTLFMSLSVQQSFFCRYFQYSGVDVAFHRASKNFLHMTFPLMHKWGCAIGISRLP